MSYDDNDREHGPNIHTLFPGPTWQKKARTLVLCFDGTNDKFDVTNTHVVRFFRILEKRNERQLVYYQAGIGTYEAPSIRNPISLKLAKLFDLALATYLEAHITGGYKFLMANYRPGDKICLFGFSRGAYTARCLAGMLKRVGLLTSGALEQVNFAYKMYASKDEQSNVLAEGFKRTFSRPVEVEFLGCWDTVSSVGVLFPRTLPDTCNNEIVKVFRQAFALDERRVNFKNLPWSLPNSESNPSISRPLKLNATASIPSSSPKPKEKPTPSPPSSCPSPTDAREVWFAGCHSDIGGGILTARQAATQPFLGNLTLEWMLREIIVENDVGILFEQGWGEADEDTSAIVRRWLDTVRDLEKERDERKFGSMSTRRTGDRKGEGSQAVSGSDSGASPRINAPLPADPPHAAAEHQAKIGGETDPNALSQSDRNDALAPVHDSLKGSGSVFKMLWWIPELLPLPQHYYQQQKKGGKVVRRLTFVPHLGRGRQVQDGANIHVSVKFREENSKYKPVAHVPEDVNVVNW